VQSHSVGSVPALRRASLARGFPDHLSVGGGQLHRRHTPDAVSQLLTFFRVPKTAVTFDSLLRIIRSNMISLATRGVASVSPPENRWFLAQYCDVVQIEDVIVKE
jgi:hypothetical protein